MFYSTRTAQRGADDELPSTRREIDETVLSAASKLAAMRENPRRGLFPEQVAATRPNPGLSASTAYRWTAASYAEMTNMDPGRKVGYRTRGVGAAGRGCCGAQVTQQAHAAAGDERAGGWEMDTAEGSATDSGRPLILYRRPMSFRLATPVTNGACIATLAGLGLVRETFARAAHVTSSASHLRTTAANSRREGNRRAARRAGGRDEALPLRADRSGGCEGSHVETCVNAGRSR